MPEQIFIPKPITHVGHNLWFGGCVNGVKLSTRFKYVVALSHSTRYEISPETTRVEFPFDDDYYMPDIERLIQVARQVNEFRKKGMTLVHCQMGLNRSGLVVALALILGGMPAKEAITLLREKRMSEVLCNYTFEDWLLNYQP